MSEPWWQVIVIDLLQISVSDEELKKGIEEDAADWHEAEAPDED